MIIEEIRKISSTKKDLRNFGLLVGGVLLAIGGVMLYRGRPADVYFLSTGSALFVLGLIWPQVLLPLQKAWMALAVVLGTVMTRLILTVLFVFVLTPIALISRALGNKYMPLGPDPSMRTYWTDRPKADRKPEDHEKQF